MNTNASTTYYQRGQALLIVVLLMVIALTVGLALISRSIINVKNTSKEADSQKAFQAAEAGVEIGLQKSLSSNDTTIGAKTLDNGAVINQVNIHSLAGSHILLNNGNPVAQDEGIDVWLANYPDYSSPWTGTVYVYWGTKTACQDSALEIIVLSGQPDNVTVARYGVDHCGTPGDSTTRVGNNKFTFASGGATIQGKLLSFSTPGGIVVTNGLLMRIIPLYASTPIGIVDYTNDNPPAFKNFSTQGRIITSVGTYGDTQRQVSFFQGYPLLPSEYFYSIFQQ